MENGGSEPRFITHVLPGLLIVLAILVGIAALAGDFILTMIGIERTLGTVSAASAAIIALGAIVFFAVLGFQELSPGPDRLIETLESGDLAELENRLRRGRRKINLKGKKGTTVLQEAVATGKTAAVELMLSYGASAADWLWMDKDFHAVTLALSRGHSGCVELLLREQQHSFGEEDLRKILEVSAEYGYSTTASLILEIQPQLDLSSSVVVAAEKGHFGLVDLLIDKGADPAATNARKASLLMILVRRDCSSHEDLIRKLLDLGVDVNHTDRDGATALNALGGYSQHDGLRRMLREAGGQTGFELVVDELFSEAQAGRQVYLSNVPHSHREVLSLLTISSYDNDAFFGSRYDYDREMDVSASKTATGVETMLDTIKHFKESHKQHSISEQIHGDSSYSVRADKRFRDGSVHSVRLHILRVGEDEYASIEGRL